MISGMWEWSFMGIDEIVHTLKLDNSQGKRLIFLDNVQIETIPSKFNGLFDFEYKFYAAGRECVIVNSALDNLNRKPPKLAIDGKYLNLEIKYFPVPPMTIYGYVFTIIVYVLSFIGVIYQFSDFYVSSFFGSLILFTFLCLVIRRVVSMALPFNISNFFKHTVRIVLSLLVFLFMAWFIF